MRSCPLSLERGAGIGGRSLRSGPLAHVPVATFGELLMTMPRILKLAGGLVMVASLSACIFPPPPGYHHHPPPPPQYYRPPPPPPSYYRPPPPPPPPGSY
jgi:hypothetical protein